MNGQGQLNLLLRLHVPLSAFKIFGCFSSENLREGRPAGRMCTACQVRGHCSTLGTLEDRLKLRPEPEQVMQVQPAGQATRGWRAGQAKR